MAEKKSPHQSPQDKHKHSVFTAADDFRYRHYRARQASKGKRAKPKRQWYQERQQRRK